jgi:hypothetical protein
VSFDWTARPPAVLVVVGSLAIAGTVAEAMRMLCIGSLSASRGTLSGGEGVTMGAMPARPLDRVLAVVALVGGAAAGLIVWCARWERASRVRHKAMVTRHLRGVVPNRSVFAKTQKGERLHG